MFSLVGNTFSVYHEWLFYLSSLILQSAIYKDGEWKSTFLTGVNMGAAKPGTFSGELAITKEEYLRWFKQMP